MRSRHNFRPRLDLGAQLEDRLVLSGAPGRQAATSALLRGINAPARAFRPHSPPSVSSLVDLAYASFQQDYRAVRATYTAGLQNGTATAADRSAFATYTQQRVNLLAQEVTNSFLQYKNGTTRGHKSDNALPLVIRQINGATDARNANPRQGTGTLVKNLTDTIPGPGASATTISLATITQDNAIEASHVATLNGVTIIRNGNFGTGSRR